MNQKYEFTLSVGDTYVQVMCDEGKDPVVRQTGILNADEVAALNCMVQTLRCLSGGINIHHYFNPTIKTEEDFAIVKCQWTRHGKLKLVGDVEKQFLHAASVEEALKRNRVFTCTRRVYMECPKSRR